MQFNHQIYHLRHSQLDQRLALLLSPIISAYRPHEPIPTREQLQEERINQSHLSLDGLVNDLLTICPLKTPINSGFYVKNQLKMH